MRRIARLLLLGCMLVVVRVTGTGADDAAFIDATAQQPGSSPAATPLASALRLGLETLRTDGDTALWSRVERFYAARAFQPAWMFPPGSHAARAAAARMRAAAGDGLNPSRYAAEHWLEQLAAGEPPVQMAAELQFSASLLRFATDLSAGAGAAPDTLREHEIITLMAAALDGASMGAALAALEPSHPEYHRLRDALGRYRAIAGSGRWVEIPGDILLRPAGGGQRSRIGAHAIATLVATLCARLQASGDLHRGRHCAADDAVDYDAELEAAVRRFQDRHGLAVDGIVGPRTIAAMNEPVEARIEQIAVNMNRWRVLPRDLGERHVRVNIAGYRLHAVERGDRALTMRVVSGRPRTPTPVMSDAITYLELRPYWNVPDRLARRDVLPRILKDRSYLTRMGFDVIDGWSRPPRIVDPDTVDWDAAPEHFPYRLRQRPGRQNAMGLAKFMFPNNYHVYLHDTPAQSLFDRRPRAHSAGCVRVEDPVALADFLLQDDPEWHAEAIEAAMTRGPRRIVPLRTPVPVHLTYFTAFAGDNRVEFRDDVYGIDREERLELAGALTVQREAGS